MLYSSDDPQVIQGVITFWDSVASILVGSACFAASAQEQLAAALSTQPFLADPPELVDSGASSVPSSSSSSSGALEHLALLLASDPTVLQAVTSLLHHYALSTGMNPLQQHAGTPGLHRLLLLTCCNAQATQQGCDKLWHQQLQALTTGNPAAAPSVAATPVMAPSQLKAVWQVTMSGLAAVIPFSDSMTIAAQMVQLAASCRSLHPSWGCTDSRDADNSSTASNSRRPHLIIPDQQEQAEALAAAAGECLAAAFCPQQGSAAQDCPYSAAMMMLVLTLFRGPSQAADSPCTAGAAAGAEEPAARASLCIAVTNTQQAAHREWLSSNHISALSMLAAAYPHPQLLMRGLLAVHLHGPHAAAPAGVDAGATAARKNSSSSREAAVLAQACRTLQAVYRSRGSLQQQAAAVHQLLVALGDVLNPAANCSVGLRAAAVQRMAAAVDDCVEDCNGANPDEVQQLQQQLWSDLSLGALLFALGWDSAVRVRRLAVQLLAKVAVPAGSPAAGQLALLLAHKCQDRDVQVQVGALELVVQLPVPVLLQHFQDEHWWCLLHAGLKYASSPEQVLPDQRAKSGCADGVPGLLGKEQQAMSEQGTAAFLQLLQQLSHLSAVAGVAGGLPMHVRARRVQQLLVLALQEGGRCAQVTGLITRMRNQMVCQ